ncbi:hypothetical protein EDB86DRAFT_3076962 [Lactarius hatsudake]|nr:hypothetical protein EDB86DRAFT_3076962 [Lactarius hatsudake]
MYLGEITRNTLLMLVDAVPQPILFGASSRGPGAAEMAAKRTTLPRRLRGIQRNLSLPRFRQETVREHLGYAPGEVSLRDAALAVRRSARLSACPVATVAF